MNKLLAILGLLLFPVVAMADASSLSFTPPSTDYSVKFLENIFGVVDGVLHGTGSQIMGNMFGVFNAAVLALGGIIIMYTLIVGTMNTAQEGEMLGHKWSSIWIPVRSTFGLALLIPKASGYCLMQIFVMWIIVQGVGAADKVWNSALDYLNRGGVIMQASMNPTVSMTADDNAIADGAVSMLAGEVCMLGLQKQLENQRTDYLDKKGQGTGPCYVGEGGTLPADMQYFCDTAVPDFLSTVDFVTIQSKAPNQTTPYLALMPNFADSVDYYHELNGMCGTMMWNPVATSGVDTTTNDAWNSTNINTISSNDISTVKTSRPTAMQQMYLDYATTARTMVTNDPKITSTTIAEDSQAYPDHAVQVFGIPYLSTGDAACTDSNPDCTIWKGETVNSKAFPAIFTGTEFQDGITDYNAIMMPTVNLMNDAKNAGQASDLRDFIKGSKEQGWLTAGSYFFDLVSLNGNAVSGGNQTDSNTGLEASSMDPKAPLSAFSSSGCVTSNAGTPTYYFLCSVLLNDSTRVTDVVNLVGSNLPTKDTMMDTKATSGAIASTVAGFIPNSMLIVQPGQPGLTQTSFGMKFNFKMETGLFRLPDQSFSCGKLPFIGCIGRAMGKVFYNEVIKRILNFFLDTLAQVLNLIVMAVMSVPLKMMSYIFINGVAIIQDTGANPIVALAQMGTAYINQAATMWVSVMNLTTMFAPFIMFIGPIVAMSTPLIFAWTGVMVGIGFVTAYYIPFLPFMIFTFGVIAWLMAVIEAMVAAPIVALGVTHPEGDGAFGKAEQALMILMNVFLRPTMMIIGYITAIGLCYVSVWIINTGFSHVVEFIQGGNAGEASWKSSSGYSNWAGIYGLFFSVLIYTGLYLTVTEKAFNLIYMLPDGILRWIGGQAEHIGGESAKWAEEQKGAVKDAGKGTQDAQGQVSKQSQALYDEKMGQAKAGIEKLKGMGGGSVGGETKP